MTKKELLALSPEKVNELAATEVMKRHISPQGRYYWWENASDGYMCRQAVNEWHPMSNIADAWLLLEKLKGDYDEVNLYWDGASWDAQFSREGTDTRRAYFGCLANLIYPVATAPAAITLACVAAELEVE